MGFDAGSTIEPLDWDFSNIRNGPPGLKDAKGVIKEPSDQLIGEFLDTQRALFNSASDKFEAVKALGEDPDPAAVMEALATLTGEDVVNLMSDTAQIYSELCSGSPSQEQILMLPLRARVGFYSWLNAEVVRPEGGSGGGKAQVISLPTAQRG